MRDDWSSGQKIAYAVICLVGTALVMWAIGVWIVEPLQAWLVPYLRATPPEVTFFVCFGIAPLVWFLTYRALRRQGKV